ncbi:hypothetical protein RMCBS344292_06291 [Rhizopus microsporus]|nr:hypothetical protein RMCBS344292_06291 [Rhizopus microsporus]
MEKLDDVLNHVHISHSEKQRLLSAIKQVKADQAQHQHLHRQSLPRIIIPTSNNHTKITTSPNNQHFDISQYIPKRTSSTESNVSKILEAFQPSILHMKTKSPTSPRINPSDPEILSKLLGKRVPLQHALTQDRRIQVTLDADTFIKLWIKESSDALTIKHAVLQKLSIDADPSYFYFYHENGVQSTIPLTDEELVRVCQSSDDSRTNRVLVVPVEGYELMCQQRSTYHDPHYVRYVLAPAGYHFANPPSIPSSELWATPPSKHLLNTQPSSWPAEQQLNVEGISLYDPPTPRNDDLDFTAVKSFTSSSATPTEPPSPIGSQKSDGDAFAEDDVLGERPSVEKLYRNIDQYLPGHDLDKEITVENNAIPPSISRRLHGHRPSVRVVAKEAHRRWRQETRNVGNTVLRRKSTKMWGSKVERVKPGEEGCIVASDKPVPTRMQWMRGELIGRGSFGRVYHALNVATGEWIAVKQVDVAVTQADKRNQDLKEAADALYHEISLLKDLDHINIVQYMGYDFNPDEGLIFIFLEYVPGGSIASLLKQYSVFEEPLISFFTRQILQGLEYLHERGILHRDIKAGNVLIDQNGICKITDFGLSKNQNESAYDSASNNSTMKGTVFWMAPEALTNNYSAKVDIW